MENIFEYIGAITGTAGAIILALKCRYSPWAWPLWLVSSLAWIAYSVSAEVYGLLGQQLVFALINVMGTWRWLIQPAVASAIAQTIVNSENTTQTDPQP